MNDCHQTVARLHPRVTRSQKAMETPDREFLCHLTDSQPRLLGYLMTLLGNLNDARDVLQETNLVLWRKMDEYGRIDDFGAWARKCAYYQALAFLRDRKRDRHIFGDDMLALFAADVMEDNRDEDVMLLALRDCLSQLPESQRRLIDQRYREGTPARKLAVETGKTDSAMKMTLMRIRETLRRCIEGKLKEALQ